MQRPPHPVNLFPETELETGRGAVLCFCFPHENVISRTFTVKVMPKKASLQTLDTEAGLMNGGAIPPHPLENPSTNGNSTRDS